jgi:stearoyl-CoA desaturase (Delta-9 desaturase)
MFNDNFPSGSVFGYFPLIILFPLIIFLFAVGTIEPVYLVGTAVGWILIGGLGIAAGYHRVFAHKTHELPVWKENIVLFLGSLGGQGSSIMWSALHRGYHHAHTDTAKDMHSPVNGLYQSFIGYTLKLTKDSNLPNFRYATDLMRKSNHIWFHNHLLKLQWGVPLAIAFFDWKLSLSLIVLPMCISAIGDNLTNICGHLRLPFGYRVAETNDNSHNNPLLIPLGWGQAWHNGHHSNPGRFIHKDRWWEIDGCVIFLPFLGKPKYD